MTATVTTARIDLAKSAFQLHGVVPVHGCEGTVNLVEPVEAS